MRRRGGIKPGMGTNNESVRGGPRVASHATVAPPAHTDSHASISPVKCAATGAAADAGAISVGSDWSQSALDVHALSPRSTRNCGRAVLRGNIAQCDLRSDVNRN